MAATLRHAQGTANSVKVPQLAWYEDNELKLDFPASWEVVICNMQGYQRRPLGQRQIASALSKPIGTDPLKALARGKKQVAIIFDDLSRPTQAAPIMPHILSQLEAAGVPAEGIRFICALGAHRALSLIEFKKKLGEAVLDRFPIYNHNPYENCTFVGKTSRGTPVSVSSEVMACDLKIGVGLIVPHPMSGFGGGGKIILPGVASIETIVANHRAVHEAAEKAGEGDEIALGKFDKNPLRLDIAEAAKMAGLDFKVDVLVNTRKQTVALFAGEPLAVHDEGVKLAKEFYATERPKEIDIVVANTYSKSNESNLAVPVGAGLLPRSGGDLVVLAITPEGQITHYLLGTFGTTIAGQLWERPRLSRRVKRLIVYAPYLDLAGGKWIAPPEAIVWARTWAQVIAELKKDYPGAARVAVIPDATIQYFPK